MQCKIFFFVGFAMDDIFESQSKGFFSISSQLLFPHPGLLITLCKLPSGLLRQAKVVGLK